MARTLLAVGLLTSALALAATPDGGVKLKGSGKQGTPKIDLNLPSFGTIPKGEDMKRVEEKPAPDRPTPTTPTGPEYTVVRVVHGKGFLKTAQGSQPSPPFPAVMASGNPLMMEKFSTVVRIKSPGKRSTSIELAILDPRADTIMSSEGQLYFRGGDEAEWQVDWDPTGIRRSGDFQVLVRVGGAPLGTFPFKVESKEDKPNPKDAG